MTTDQMIRKHDRQIFWAKTKLFFTKLFVYVDWKLWFVTMVWIFVGTLSLAYIVHTLVEAFRVCGG